MNLSHAELLREAGASGFEAEPLEKVLRLVGLLEDLAVHPFLKGRVALKGDTALNLFLFDLPRLSVDIDLNYIGAADRETMLAERPRVEQAIGSVCARQRIEVRRSPGDHAGGKWRLSFIRTSGGSTTLELDLNFMLRVPLWPVRCIDSRPIGSFVARRVPVLDLHELAAGKLAALLARNASRDLFDASALLRRKDLDLERLRLAFVVYGGLNRVDWRTVGLDHLQAEPAEVKQRLQPLLRRGDAEHLLDAADWARAMLEQVRSGLSWLLPLNEQATEFLTRLNDHGEIRPELLTTDVEMQARLVEHPGLLWKALNVRRHKGEGFTAT